MSLVSCWILVAFCLIALLACVAASTSQHDEALLCYGTPAMTSGKDLLGPASDLLDSSPTGRDREVLLDVDALSTELPMPVSCSNEEKHDEFVQEVLARNEAEGNVLQQELTKAKPPENSSILQNVAQKVERSAVLAASPDPPRFEPLSLDVLPQKYWQPVFSGCQSTFTDERCDFSFPTPRLWVPTLNELQYARSLEQNRTNLIEPMEARQALTQLLSLGVRTRKDVYTQASPANDIASQSSCARLKQRSPSHVRR